LQILVNPVLLLWGGFLPSLFICVVFSLTTNLHLVKIRVTQASIWILNQHLALQEESSNMGANSQIKDSVSQVLLSSARTNPGKNKGPVSICGQIQQAQEETFDLWRNRSWRWRRPIECTILFCEKIQQ
jgi:hypothetical protein